LTLVGICIGIATVVALVGLGEGLREGVTAQFNLLGNDVLTVSASGTGQGPPGTGVVNPLTIRQLERIQQVSGVRVAYGRLVSPGIVSFRGESDAQFIGSFPGEHAQAFYENVNLVAEYGRLPRRDETNKVAVGNSFSVDGNKFTRGLEVGNRITIAGNSYEVVGILERKGSFVIDETVLMHEDEMRTIFNRDDELDMIAAQVSSINDIPQVRDNIIRVLQRERGVRAGSEDFTVETAASRVESLDSILSAVNIFIIALASISIVVGGIGIANTMFTSVLERTNQIGVMKAVGARNSDIFYLFIIESGFLGLVGGIVGVTIGVTFAYAGAYAASTALGVDIFRASIGPELVIGAMVGAFVIGAISGMLPALRASRLVPVDALRYGK